MAGGPHADGYDRATDTHSVKYDRAVSEDESEAMDEERGSVPPPLPVRGSQLLSSGSQNADWLSSMYGADESGALPPPPSSLLLPPSPRNGL